MGQSNYNSRFLFPYIPHPTLVEDFVEAMKEQSFSCTRHNRKFWPKHYVHSSSYCRFKLSAPDALAGGMTRSKPTPIIAIDSLAISSGIILAPKRPVPTLILPHLTFPCQSPQQQRRRLHCQIAYRLARCVDQF